MTKDIVVKLLMHPGVALFGLAVLALIVWLAAPSLPILGGFIKFAAFITMIFGLVGGFFLTVMVNRAEAP